MYGPQTALDMLASDPMLSHTKIITVYWDKGRNGVRHMGSYNNDYSNVVRKLLKGDENQLESYMGMSRKNPDNSAVINYITNHNGFTLMDLVSFDRKHNEHNGENNLDGENFNYSWNCGVEGKSRKKKIVELRQRQMKNAFMMLLFSAGTPLILAGDEFENSQGGNNNPYCIDSETTWLNWKKSDEACDMEKFVKKLIRYRLGHKILHMEKQLYASDSKSCGYPDVSYHGTAAWYQAMENYNRHIGTMYCTNYDGGEHEDGYELIYVGLNMHFENHQLALPKLPDGAVWEQRISSGEEMLEIVDERYVNVPPRTTVVLRAVIKNAIEKEEKNDRHKQH
jgi:glycogen operon protein